ncbi:MAG: hypothetical protein Q7K33_00870 [Candidatus Berkelbacteria bacterium]|nr:hypothetical protein [Candidatus Berkelbacteria bacterium]
MKRLILIVVSAALSCVAFAQFSLAGGLYNEKETKTVLEKNLAIFFSARDSLGNRVGTFDGSGLRKPAVVRGMILDGTIIPLNWEIKSLDLKFIPLEQTYRLDVDDANGWIIGQRAKGDLAFRYKIDTSNLPNGDNVWAVRISWRDRKDHQLVMLLRWVSHPTGNGQQLLSLVVREMPPGADPLTGKNTNDLRGIELFPYTEGFTNLVASPSGVPQSTTMPGQKVEKRVDDQVQTKNQQKKVEDEPEDIPVPVKPKTHGGLNIGYIPYDDWKEFVEDELTIDEQKDPALVSVSGNELELPSTERLAIYIVSDRPIDKAQFLVGSKTYELVPYQTIIGGQTIFFVRTSGKCSTLNGGKLVIKQGAVTRTVRVKR